MKIPKGLREKIVDEDTPLPTEAEVEALVNRFKDGDGDTLNMVFQRDKSASGGELLSEPAMRELMHTLLCFLGARQMRAVEDADGEPIEQVVVQFTVEATAKKVKFDA